MKRQAHGSYSNVICFINTIILY